MTESLIVKMSRIVLFVISISLVAGLCRADRVRYDNYNIYQVKPQTRQHINLLRLLERTSDSLKFLTPLTTVGRSVDILVAPHKEPEFLDILKDKNVPNDLVQENLQNLIDAEELSSSKRRSNFYDWTMYPTLDETYDWLKSLSLKYPDKVSLLVAGTTYEKRSILGVKVSFKPGNRGVFLEAGIHSREWIAPATVTFILNQLLTSQEPSIRAVAEKFDWYIIPHANPDGYVYTHTHDRLWRKTRSPSLLCYGADPNRNWDFYWNYAGSSSSGCSDLYAGSAPFSEVETRTLSEFIKGLDGKIDVYVAFHSFSQMLLFPYGHTSEHVSNFNDLQQIGNATAAALAKRYDTKYVVGSIYEIIYPASGSSMDWVYGTTNVKLTFAYELRPASSSIGFLLPADQIIPTGLETLDSIVTMLNEAEKLNYFQ